MNLYFIAVLPPREIREEIERMKFEMQALYGAGHALKSPAHITLQMPFRYAVENESELVGALQTLADREAGFIVQLKDFDCFSPRVIFVKITDHAPIVRLRNRLQSILRDEVGLKGTNLDHNFHPHLTIATRDLSPEIFPKAWEDYSGRSYSAEFEVSAIAILKHNGRHWDVYRELPFAAHNS